MRSTPPAGNDATARARIREAAIRRYGIEGFSAGLRAIAGDAGVSPGLVLHHFGSKDGLRRECDAYVLAAIRDQKSAALSSGGPAAALAAMAEIDHLAPLVAYALRSMQAGGDVARSFFEQFVADAEQYIAEGVASGVLIPSRDEAARARYLTLVGFGAILLDMALCPPDDPADVAAVIRGYLERMGLPSIELFTQGLYADHRMLDAYLLYVGDPPSGDVRSSDPR